MRNKILKLASAALTILSVVDARSFSNNVLKRNQEPSQPSCSNFTPFAYAGCFSDLSSPRSLLFSGPSNQNMTVEKCVAFCKGNGYKYAGLEYYQECFCGATVNGPQVNESSCSFPCTGDKTETCGGNDLLNVYQDVTFPVVNKSTISDYMSMGCYSEGSMGRSLAWRQNQLNASAMTVETCLSACKNGAYSFGGLEFGKECYCGIVLGNGTLPLNSTSCNIPCTGDASETCGGKSTLNLYVAKDLESTQPCNGGGDGGGDLLSSSSSAAPSTTLKPSSPSSSSSSQLSLDSSVPTTPSTTISDPPIPSDTSSTVDTTSQASSSVPTASPLSSSSSETSFSQSGSSDQPVSSSSTSGSISSSNPTKSSELPSYTPTLSSNEVPSSISHSSTSCSSTYLPIPSSDLAPYNPSPTSSNLPPYTPSPSSPVPSSSPSPSTECPPSASPPTTSDLPPYTPLPTSSKPPPYTPLPSSPSTYCPPTSTTPTSSKPPVYTLPLSSTKSNPSLCTTTIVSTAAPTCEYKLGNWCSTPLPPFSSYSSCLATFSTCISQLTSCLLLAGFPNSLDCFQFSAWCTSVSGYCSAYCPGPSCSINSCKSKYPPPSPPSVVKTITSIYTCSAAPTTVATSTKPSTTTTCVPIPTYSNICQQPSCPNGDYSPSSPVGGIPMPCLTCNNLYSSYISGYPFKLYTDPDTSSCPSYPRSGSTGPVQACRDACDKQYEGCMDTYAEGCRQRKKRDLDSYADASQKCLAQRNDCYDVNAGVTVGAGRCGGWNQGWW